MHWLCTVNDPNPFVRSVIFVHTFPKNKVFLNMAKSNHEGFIIDQRRRRWVPASTTQMPIITRTPNNKSLPQHALVINLPESTERLAAFKKNNHFKGDMTVLWAVDGKKEPPVPKGIPLHPGDLGCLLSHKAALEHARDEGWDMVVIFEDDAIMVPDFDVKLRQAMAELPDGWDMLWLGGSDNRKTPSEPYSKHLKRLKGSWGTYGYIIREWCYDYFINLFSEKKRSSDDYFRVNHARFRSFRTVENLVRHTSVATSDRLRINADER